MNGVESVLQGGTRAPEPQLQARHLNRAPLDLAGSPYLTVPEAAQRLKISLNALRCRMKRGTLPSWTWRKAGRSVRFVRRSLDEWLDAEERHHGSMSA